MTDSPFRKNQLLYLAFGPNEDYHSEARFSILSAYYQSKTNPLPFFISVYTDAPHHYDGLPVEIHRLTKDTLKQWVGPLGYGPRAKLCALQAAVPLAGKTVFIDTDTFFRRDPQLLFAAVNDNTCLSDELYRGRLPEQTAKDTAVSETLMRLAIDPQDIPLINSGLFGVTYNNRDILEKAILLNDVIYPASDRNWTVEQLSLGLAASTRTQLVEDAGVIKHYWSRKLFFRAKAQAFLARHGENWDTAAARGDFRRVTPVLPKPPWLARWPLKMIALLVPSRERQLLLELLYSRYPYQNPFDRACCMAWQQKAIENYVDKKNQTSVEDCRLFGSLLARAVLGRDVIQMAAERLRERLEK